MKPEEAKLLKKGQQIARTLIDSGLTIKECSLPNKRVDYFRGDHFKEHLEKNLDKVAKIYCTEEEAKESRSMYSIAQKMMKEGLLVKLDRVKEEKVYKWPRKLAYSNVIASIN